MLTGHKNMQTGAYNIMHTSRNHSGLVGFRPLTKGRTMRTKIFHKCSPYYKQDMFAPVPHLVWDHECQRWAYFVTGQEVM